MGRPALHPVDLPDIVQWNVLVVAGELQCELGALVEHGLIQFPSAAAARRKEDRDQENRAGYPHASEYRTLSSGGLVTEVIASGPFDSARGRFVRVAIPWAPRVYRRDCEGPKHPRND